jgi:hypothetical protein
MFINLTARKDNGDFYITSSEVIRDSFPVLLTDEQVRELLEERAHALRQVGWSVEIKEEEAV